MVQRAIESTGKTRLQSIDSLRGLAALLVICLHVAEYFILLPEIKSHGTALADAIIYYDLGRVGITVFFLISGYVICASLYGEKWSGLKRFVVRRFFRLFPLFWFSIALVWWSHYYMMDLPFSASLVLANSTMIPAVLGQPFMMGLYWTLETELLFYVLMGFMFMLSMLTNSRRIVLLMLMLLGVLGLFYLCIDLRPSLPHWYSTPYHLLLMFCGVLYRYVEDDNHTERSVQRDRRLMFIVGISTVFLPLLANLYLVSVDNLVENLQDVRSYLCGIGIFFLGMRTRLFNVSWLSRMGLISYSMYLLHPVVFVTLHLGWMKWFGHMPSVHISLYILLTATLTVILSRVTYRFVERPFIEYAKKLEA